MHISSQANEFDACLQVFMKAPEEKKNEINGWTEKRKRDKFG